VLKGLLASLIASVLFGLLYYAAPLLAPLDGEQIFGWRILATLPFTTLLLLTQKKGVSRRLGVLMQRVQRQPLLALALLGNAALLGLQLWLFMWAPLHGRALPVSLGYFLLPLVMVLTGRILYRERLTALQRLATVLAALGVLHEILRMGGMSWEVWLVAIGYTAYFVVRRHLRCDNLAGHWLDLLLLAPAACWFVARAPSSLTLLAEPSPLWFMVPILGFISAIALALYMAANRLLPLGLFGLLSYVEPVLLALAAFLLGESIAPAQWPTYGPIFAAVAVLIIDSAWRLRYA